MPESHREARPLAAVAVGEAVEEPRHKGSPHKAHPLHFPVASAAADKTAAGCATHTRTVRAVVPPAVAVAVEAEVVAEVAVTSAHAADSAYTVETTTGEGVAEAAVVGHTAPATLE